MEERNQVYMTESTQSLIHKLEPKKCMYCIMHPFPKNNFVPDALVVDPPRTGLDDKMIETILKYRPNKFVYVSCNPSTLARDLVKLVKIYNVEYIQSVDMFPQTARVEAVVKLSKK